MNKHNITPIFVFDGKRREEKEDTYNKRKIAEQKAIEEKEKVIKMIKETKMEILEEVTRNKISHSLEYKEEDLEFLIINLLQLNITCLQANSDAEQLCSVLAIEEKVSAVFSTDTDVLVYGCPIQIIKISGENCVVILLEVVLDILEFYYYDNQNIKCYNMKMFVDFCIMCGCDFNKNIKNIGPAKAYNLIKQYENIENIEHEEKDKLRYERCREIFKYVESDAQNYYIYF
jgi:flap endonuclease-1